MLSRAWHRVLGHRLTHGGTIAPWVRCSCGRRWWLDG